MRKIHLGTVSWGTLRSEDLIPRFVEELRRIRGSLPKTIYNIFRIWENGNLSSAEESEFVDELVTTLDGYAPPYCYFGTTEGDGADFGFWVSPEWRENAREDDAPVLCDSSGLTPEFRGVWFQVSDHGNVTCFRRVRKDTDIELWGIV